MSPDVGVGQPSGRAGSPVASPVRPHERRASRGGSTRGSSPSRSGAPAAPAVSAASRLGSPTACPALLAPRRRRPSLEDVALRAPRGVARATPSGGGPCPCPRASRTSPSSSARILRGSTGSASRSRTSSDDDSFDAEIEVDSDDPFEAMARRRVLARPPKRLLSPSRGPDPGGSPLRRGSSFLPSLVPPESLRARASWQNVESLCLTPSGAHGTPAAARHASQRREALSRPRRIPGRGPRRPQVRSEVDKAYAGAPAHRARPRLSPRQGAAASARAHLRRPHPRRRGPAPHRLDPQPGPLGQAGAAALASRPSRRPSSSRRARFSYKARFEVPPGHRERSKWRGLRGEASRRRRDRGAHRRRARAPPPRALDAPGPRAGARRQGRRRRHDSILRSRSTAKSATAARRRSTPRSAAARSSRSSTTRSSGQALGEKKDVSVTVPRAPPEPRAPRQDAASSTSR